MKIPYGIWNSVDIRYPSFSILFEDSLWDLKQSMEHRHASLPISLKIPYGIWNADYVSKGNRKDIEFEDSLWDLKLRYQKEFWAYSQFEDSLWDLKR